MGEKAGRSSVLLALCFLVSACVTRLEPPVAGGGPHEQAVRIASEVSRLRGLAERETVPLDIRDEEGIKQGLRVLIDREWTVHDDGTERAYKSFGLLPPDMDVKSYLADLYAEQLAGYYDPKQGEFFVAQESVSEDDEYRYVVAHELQHALQDQHFDLQALHQRFASDNDREIASAALVEGDALMVAFDHQLWRMGAPMTLAGPWGRRAVWLVARIVERYATVGDRPQAKKLASAPDILRTELIFPYSQGVAFVSAIRADFGWEGVDAVFHDLPDSTEQIIHPERYIDRRDRPVSVHLADPETAWTPVFEESLGMLGTQVLLREHLGGRAVRAAEGWDGDRYVVWETPDGEVLGWLSVWDRPYQAWRFSRVYRRLLERKHGDAVAWTVRRQGDVVVAVEGGRREEVAAVAERLLGSRIDRPEDDEPPPGPFGNTLRWPLRVERLDRAFEISVLGGHIFRIRTHDRGHRLALLDGAVLRSERTPDRRQLSLALGQLWFSSDRNHDFRAAALPVVADFHTRGTGPERASALSLLRIPLLGNVFAYRSQRGLKRVRLLQGLVFDFKWGDQGRKLSVFMVPIPGL